MNTKAFLRDWQPGDIVTADDMQALTDTVAMLEADADTRGGAVRGACRRISDGPQGWAWQVVALHGKDKYELRVLPGKVLAGCRMTGLGAGLGEEEVAYTYLELPATSGADVVQDYDATKDVATVYLELTGRVVRRYLTAGDMLEAGLMDDPYGMMTDAEKAQKTGHEEVTLEDAALRVTCAPVDTALRIWPLAVVNKAHKQPVTQLIWGELSALECRGIARADGQPVWPSDRTQAAAWGTEEHAEGMDVVAPVEFSTDVERIEGELSACMDEDGALEFYLGQYTEPGEIEDPPIDDPPWEEEEEEEEEAPPGPFYPPGGGGSSGGGGGGGSGITRVRYGYIAGEGFLSCDLVRAGNNKLYWQLELDPDYLSRICADLPCSATVTVQADGVQDGVHSDVEMGLGAASVTATGMMLRGTVALEFGGLDGDDVSTKKVTRKVTYKGNPIWSQPRTWYLTPKKVHRAGRYVKMDKAARGYDPGGFVEARQWYRFRVNKATFTRAARNEFMKALSAIKVQDNQMATSYDSCVVGTLTGTATAPIFDFKLKDA
jgi:hypothetical protein